MRALALALTLALARTLALAVTLALARAVIRCESLLPERILAELDELDELDSILARTTLSPSPTKK